MKILRCTFISIKQGISHNIMIKLAHKILIVHFFASNPPLTRSNLNDEEG